MGKIAKPAWRAEIAGYEITLYQQSAVQRSRFIVIYGVQRDSDLTYTQACSKLGEAILHALTCEGKIKNIRSGAKEIEL